MVQEQVSNKCGIASEDISHVGGDGKDHPQRGVAPEGEGVGESAGLFGRSGGVQTYQKLGSSGKIPVGFLWSTLKAKEKILLKRWRGKL